MGLALDTFDSTRQQEAPSAAKRPYEAPKVQRLGRVVDLTLNNNGATSFDVGFFNNTKIQS
jgi:hypothetical protein